MLVSVSMIVYDLHPDCSGESEYKGMGLQSQAASQEVGVSRVIAVFQSICR
jgi:hypothetical protein